MRASTTFRRRSRLLAPGAIVAGFMLATAIAWACSPGMGTTTVTPRSGDPGSTLTASATGAPVANVAYDLKMSRLADACHHSTRIGGPRTAEGTNIPATRGRVPDSATSGQHFVCFAYTFDSTKSTPPTSFTVL